MYQQKKKMKNQTNQNYIQGNAILQIFTIGGTLEKCQH